MRFFTLIFFVFIVEFSGFASDNITLGKKQIIHSKIIGEDINFWVYVPEDVKKDEPLYVIYLLDGKDHFHTVTGIVKSLTDYEQIPKTMVVGIETTNRPRDFLPKINGEPKTKFQKFVSSKRSESGQDNFLNFIGQELIPFIDKSYSTNPHRTIIGHSNGGTLALSAMFNKPELFNNYLAISPNGWWSQDETVKNVKKLKNLKHPKRKLFISVSGEGGRFYSGTLDLLSNMEQNKPTHLDWQFKHYPERTHMSGILPAVSEGLEYLYSDLNFKITSELAKYAQVSAIKSYYAELSKQFGFKIPIPVDIYVAFAEQQQINQRQEEAINTLIQFVIEYPDKPYAHMRLAQGYTKVNKFKKAHKSFVQALKLAKQQKREVYIIDALQDMVDQAKSKL